MIGFKFYCRILIKLDQFYLSLSLTTEWLAVLLAHEWVDADE